MLAGRPPSSKKKRNLPTKSHPTACPRAATARPQDELDAPHYSLWLTGKSRIRLFDGAGRKRMNRRSQEAPETPGVGREPLHGDAQAGHHLG